MKTIELKTWKEFFQQTWLGVKAFELRKDDRNYEEGDILILREWDQYNNCYTGRQVTRRVDYVLKFASPEFGLAPGYAILGVIPV